MIQLRPEQKVKVDETISVLAKYHIAYLAAEVRTGKTIMALSVAHTSNHRYYGRVCFITKKKAISSIETDYRDSGYHFDKFTVTNFEQVHTLAHEYDLYIIDEAHSLGAFAKPSGRTKKLRELIGTSDVLLMSGTPNPETYSQLYHQFWVSQHGPFQRYTNFYKWSKDFVNVTKKFINGFDINDYSEAKEKEVKDAVRPYMVQFSQEEAGFVSYVEEEIIKVPIDARMYQLMAVLKKDKVYKMKCGDYIVADTKVRMQSLFHQISSGTVIASDLSQEERIYHALDESKAWFIKTRFAGQKIAIYYLFKQEFEVLKKVFPEYTDVPEDFNASSHLTFICQMKAGSMGINISTADALVMYNIDFSAMTYWQVRARMQTKDRVKASKMYWIFSEQGIEEYVYKSVVEKKDYTAAYFVKDFDIKFPKKTVKYQNSSGRRVFGSKSSSR
jgi:hypothetical protein